MVKKFAKPIDNSQAQPQAAVPVPFLAGKLEKLTKDILPLTLRNAGAAVPYLDTQHVTAPTTSDDDPAPQCIAHSIGYQIEQYPFESRTSLRTQASLRLTRSRKSFSRAA